jgi:HemK-related putative methylase
VAAPGTAVGAPPNLPLACPVCRSALQLGEDGARCTPCGMTYELSAGIWRLLPKHRAAALKPIIQRYETVRSREGWGSQDPSYYRDLPFRDTSGRFVATWRIRAANYRTLIRRVIGPLERRERRPLVILELGAGNGWLSNRLAQRGNRVAAVDLLTNDLDGLGARQRYGGSFVAVQADFDQLPLPAGVADLAIFSAALHYSPDARATLGEARRVLRERGVVVIVDTPVYHDEVSGLQMVRESDARFLRDHAVPGAPASAEGFLTHARLRRIAPSLGLRWRVLRPLPWWSMRAHALWARMRGRRETATLPIIVGHPSATLPLLAGDPGPAALLWRVWLLLRFDLFQRHRHDHLVLEKVAGAPIVVLPQVFNPALFRTGEFLASLLDRWLVKEGTGVLDMGTGSGAVAVAAARLGARVMAVDINPHAVRCARINALLNRVEDHMDVRHGDLFAPVGERRFDLVLFNPPYFRGVPKNEMDRAWRATDVVERFAAGLPAHLAPGGRALVLLSTDGDAPAFLRAFETAGLDVEVFARRHLINEVLTVYLFARRANR